MASQIYSRWVPSAKKKSTEAPTITAPKIEAVLSPPVAHTPPTTRHDASATYSRYIPPSKLKSSLQEVSGPQMISPTSQKRKRDEHSDETSKSKKAKNQEEIIYPEAMKINSKDIIVADQAPKSKKLSKRKRITDNKDGGDPEVGSTEQANGDCEMRGDIPNTVEMVDSIEKKKKRKPKNVPEIKVDGSECIINEDQNTMDLDENDKSIAVKEKKSKSKDKKKRDIPDETLRGGDEDEESNKKHLRLMKKRQKSLKVAEALTQVEDAPTKEDSPEEAIEIHDLVPLPQPEPIAEPLALAASEALPLWMTSPIRILPTVTAKFLDLGIGQKASEALENAGYKEAFAVQAAVLPLLLPAYESGDVLVSASTGSGKTLAYVLPMIEKLGHFTTTELRGIIVMPTRELVMQAKAVADTCSVAFSNEDRKRVIVGTAVGNETLSVEQSKLMSQTLVYNPEQYRSVLEKENGKWDESCNELEYGPLFDNEMTVSNLPSHLVEFTSRVDVLICTPGRLVEHLKSTPGFTLEHISMLVVDEADKLLDQSFQQWVQVILAALGPRSPHKQVTKVILSATMTRDIGQLSQLNLYRPRFVELEGPSHDGEDDHKTHTLPRELVESGVKTEDESLKPLYLLEVLRRHNLVLSNASIESDSDSSDDDSEESSSNDDDSIASSVTSEETELPASTVPHGVLIFTKSNETAVRLSRLIALLAPSEASRIGTLTSTLPRASRDRTIRSFSTGTVSILVASDLVSRGLDLPNLAHVINYDVPTSLTSYIHRVGRTARAGKAGHAWTLFTETEAGWFWHNIARVESVQRERKVERLNIYKDKFDEDEKRRYQEALDELGTEATGYKAKRE
jgi:ATP-dependent RNA helicase DDX51/DBP6